jgi:transcription elongation GreA/GreB family factor
VTTPSKRALLDELVALLGATLEAARAAHRSAIEGATHAEARPENDKDTRGLEQSYLARGQAQRIEELEAELAEVAAMELPAVAADAPARLGCVVEVLEGDRRRRYLVAPHGGGVELAGEVQVVTPRSPVGQALLGKRAGDEVELRLRGAVRELEIVAIV